jgi:hypothetical protein
LLRIADADEDVGVPAEKFSSRLGGSVRGLRRRRCGGPPSRCEATAWCGNWFAPKIEFNKGSGCQFLQFFWRNWAQAAFSFKKPWYGIEEDLGVQW